MSNERIDHAAEAVSLGDVGIESLELKQVAHAQATFTLAQVHATLAMVEQQRIANLIALAAIEFDVGDGGKARIVRGVVDIRQTDYGLLDVEIDPDIAAALGLETPND